MSQSLACGKGLAAKSLLPAKLSLLLHAMADVLAFHQKSLEITDANASAELRVYAKLEEQYRAVAWSLQSTAEMMAATHDLAAAPHDVSILATRENAALFERFIQCERDLLSYLERAIAADAKI